MHETQKATSVQKELKKKVITVDDVRGDTGPAAPGGNAGAPGQPAQPRP